MACPAIRPLVELCVEPAGLCGRCTWVAGPLRVMPSPTGLPSKRGPGLGSFSITFIISWFVPNSCRLYSVKPQPTVWMPPILVPLLGSSSNDVLTASPTPSSCGSVCVSALEPGQENAGWCSVSLLLSPLPEHSLQTTGPPRLPLGELYLLLTVYLQIFTYR